MKYRLLAVLLCLAMITSFSPDVLAVQERDTDYFTPRSHTDLSFSDLAYAPVDLEDAISGMDALRALSLDSANLSAILPAFLNCAKAYCDSLTMYLYAMILSSQDVNDEARRAEAGQAYEKALLLSDALYTLAGDILRSPCAEALYPLIVPDDREYLLSYTGMDDEMLKTSTLEQELESEYWVLEAADYENEEDRAAALGSLFLRLIAVRQEIAAQYGYENYTDYAYSEAARDYTKEDMQAFQAAVKACIVPVYQELLSQLYDTYFDAEELMADYSGEIYLEVMEPYVSSLSDELYEAFHYMRTHGFYDIDYREGKSAEGYTVNLSSLGAPFFYNQPTGMCFYDLRTAIHEFGHFNNFYWLNENWYCGSKNTDISEVHSQALELLFSAFYPQIYVSNSEAAQLMQILLLLQSIINGAMEDELQQYAYAAEEVTVEQISRKYAALKKEYGLLDADAPAEVDDAWVNVSHTFTAPLYYISYAVSAAGAFSFWLEAKEDYSAAIDDYLRFTALDLEYGFQDSFLEIGMDAPITPSYLEDLAERLSQTRPLLLPFSDVHDAQWFFDATYFVYALGLMDGTDFGVFAPNGTMTRAMAVTVLHRLSGLSEADTALSFLDVPEDAWFAPAVRWAVENGLVSGYNPECFGPDDPITRQDLAVMLYRLLLLFGDTSEQFTPDESLYSDASTVADYAVQAMGFFTQAGILSGSDGLLRPEYSATRAETAQLLMNLFLPLD